MLVNVDSLFRAAVLVAIGALTALSVYIPRGMLMDGASFVLAGIRDHSFALLPDGDGRFFANYVAQSPLVSALKLSVTDIGLLIRIHSLGIVGIPLLMWTVAIALQYRTNLFWLFVGAFSVSYGISGVAMIGEFNLAFAATALFTSIVTSVSALSAIQGGVLLILAILLTRSYETSVFLNPLLAIFCIERWRLQAEKRTVEFLLICSIAALLFGAFVGLYWIIFPRVCKNWPRLQLCAAMGHSNLSNAIV